MLLADQMTSSKTTYKNRILTFELHMNTCVGEVLYGQADVATDGGQNA